ncbi:Ig-like domain repeat protein [Nocardia sp. NBC_01388]|uniref:Ig-like domain repeat protein n=1 Tax=Nocardia sp. NBC_01388 TaxID=2903596 RepID=UPI003245CF0E
MHAFDPNDYRKRVLAAVERRGGIDHSDAFELYDIPLEEAPRLGDAEVRARIEEVWGFWQKQRDHPKYRVLAGLLVDEHAQLSAPLLDAGMRRIEAERVKHLRARRDSERYEMLDSAVERLVQRHGAIPAGKIPGLEDIGKLSGLDPAEVQARLRRHRILDEDAAPAPAPAGVSVQRRQQIRKLLAEYDRLLPGDPVPTLLALLGLDFTKARHTSEIRLRAEALRARTRELPPGRVRVVLDELLVHVSDLLEPGGSAMDGYLQAVIDDVTDLLRPKVRAAVLVEDRLVEGDHAYLIGEAIAAGLDHPAAERVILALADELGTTVEGAEPSPSSGPQNSAAPPISYTRTRPSSGTTSQATGAGSNPAAGRAEAGAGTGDAGSADTAQSGAGAGYPGASAGSSRTTSGAGYAGSGRGATDSPDHGATSGYHRTSGGSQPRPWEEPLKAARAAIRAGHPCAAASHVAQAQRSVGDDSLGATSVRPIAELVERVLAEAAVRWRGARAGCAGKRYVEALDHLEYLRRAASDVPNPESGGPSLEELTAQARTALAEADRLFAAAPAAPVAARMRALRAIFDICADHADTAAALSVLPVDAPGQVTANRKPDGTVVIAWSPSTTEQTEYRVTRLQPDGSWRVVGRTRGTALEDGAAMAGPVPVYGVVASIAGRASEVTRSDGQARPQEAAPAAPAEDPTPSGMPAVRDLAERAGLLLFEWPAGITEVMVVARTDAPPVDPDDARADRKWKVTNTRYQIDGGAKLPTDLLRPCHLGVASCRREASGVLTVAAGFAPAARIRLDS